MIFYSVMDTTASGRSAVTAAKNLFFPSIVCTAVYKQSILQDEERQMTSGKTTGERGGESDGR